MAEMNEREIIRCFEEIAKYDLPAETVERHLQDVRRRLLSQPQTTPVKRTISIGRWVGLAAAAVIVVAAVAFWRLFPSPRLQAAELLTQAAKNLEKLPWVKVVTEKYRPDQDAPIEVEVIWANIANKRTYQVCANKSIELADFQSGQRSVYRPDTNDLTIEPFVGNWSSERDIQGYVAKLTQKGISVRQSEILYQGCKAIALEFDDVLNDIGPSSVTNMMMDGKTVKIIRQKLIIDPNIILGSAEISYLERNGQVISVQKSHFEPLTKGPADIYELGVPRNVKIISRVPDPAVKSLRQTIENHRKQFLNEYIAVITESLVEGDSERMLSADVVFCQGRKLRVDVYSMQQGRDKLFSQHRAELAESLKHLSPFWPDEGSRDIQATRLYDGLWQYIVEAKVEITADDELRGRATRKLVERERQRRPDGDEYSDDDVDDFGWRTLWWLNEPEHMYEDSYLKEHGFIGMELTSQSGVVVMPKRLVLYVDPQKDDICHRYLEEELFDAPWQTDKTWLDKAENKNALEEHVRDRQVSEYAHTGDGQWYPKVITENTRTRRFNETAPREEMRVIRIHLVAEHPQFPAGIFDPAKLPQVKP
jgi:hypothetical protein